MAAVEPNQVGLRLGKTLFGPDERPLLKAGVKLTPAFVEALGRRGFTTVYVDDALTADLEVGEIITEETRAAAMAIITESLERVKKAGHLNDVNLAETRDTVRRMLSDLAHAGDLLAEVSLLRSRDNVTFTHSVNMAILCLLVGQALGYSQDDLVKPGQGALLHDLGKMEVLNLIPSRTA